MRILVAVKRVIDYAAAIRVKTDCSGVETAGVRMSLNPFCEIAVAEAVRMRERGSASQVIVATVGPAASADVIRKAIAIGADSGVHVEELPDLEQLQIARLLAALAKRQGADLVLLGKQSIDSDQGHTGPMLAALLGWPQATNASRIQLDTTGRTLTVDREVDDGRMTVELDLPAVVTADLRLNEPRYVTLPAMLRAKKAPLEKLTAAELGVDLKGEPLSRLLRVDPPAPRPPGVRVNSVDELLAALKQRGVIVE